MLLFGWGATETWVALIEKKGTPEVNRPHANGLRAAPDALKLACGEAQIQLLAARFRFVWPAHGRGSLQSACVLGFGGHRPAPNE